MRWRKKLTWESRREEPKKEEGAIMLIESNAKKNYFTKSITYILLAILYTVLTDSLSLAGTFCVNTNKEPTEVGYYYSIYQSDQYCDEPPEDSIAEVYGVPAFPRRNGYDWETTSWQCVEYAKRFVSTTLGVDLFTGSTANGKDFANFLADSHGGVFQKYPNELTEPPQVGDIISFYPTNSNPWGHVAIVSDVNIDMEKIQIVEQNISRFNGYNDVPITVSYVDGIPSVSLLNSGKGFQNA